jgi:hypothetical protein
VPFIVWPSIALNPPGALLEACPCGLVGYDSHLSIDYKSKLWYGFVSSLMRGVSGDDPEGGAGSGVLRLRLVTAGSGGPGHRPLSLKN